MLTLLLDALLFRAGYNAAVVTLGATLLGIAAGTAGTFLFLRKRALVSDAIAHSTLPGIGLAFIVMTFFGGDGRSLPGLLAGSAISAAIGLLLVEWIARNTRLAEDTAIGAVLSVFFGFGIVLLTIIQTMTVGRQAGLQNFLLGSTAGMLFSDAVLIAAGSALVMAAVIVLRRPLTMVAFDREFSATVGIDPRLIDLAIMALVLAVTIVGLKIVGLILVVALLIIPAVAARFWSNRTEMVAAIAGLFGGASGYLGSAISTSAAHLPTGPIIVLVCFAIFAFSLLFAPERGALAALLRHRAFQLRVHMRQGLLALAHDEAIFDPLTIRVLRRAGLVRGDLVPTPSGRAQALRALHDERRWHVARTIYQDEAIAGRFDGLTPIDEILTRDQIGEIDRQIVETDAMGWDANGR